MNESIRGADIDLFIEDNGTGRYHFFMLQAKIMNYEGKYKDIKNWSVNAQFYKLLRASNSEGAFPLYLLYNGGSVNSNLGNSQFGLSIVEATVIRNIRVSQRRNWRNPLITFNQLQAFNMKPFHVLFCQIPKEYKLPETIDGNAIYKGYPYINKGEGIEKEERKSEFEEKKDSDSIMIIKSKNLAPFRIVLKSD
ncbi:MAG: hypothetical protein IPP32_16440 [Bacteroidetes bacterium]|nr:hypothetical protein [Bacteroidota bacterium]